MGLAAGLASGVVMHRSDFCIAGMFRDLILFRKAVMIRMLFLLVITSMILFEIARQAGFLPLYPFPLLYPPTPANLIGGFLFGIGMVLAGGCVVGTLYRMGAGSVLSAVAFGGLIGGSALYAEVHPSWSAFVKATTFFPGKITIAQVSGVDPIIPLAAVSAAGLFVLFRWQRQGLLVRRAAVQGYLQPWKAAIALSLTSTASYVLVGMPMGITSSFVKIGGYIEQAIFPAHMEGLSFFKAVSLKYTYPLTGVYLQGGPGPVADALAVIQFPIVAGIIIGSAVSAVSLKEFHLHFRVPAKQYVSVLAGGVIMGLASRMAPTCNVWHLLGGLPILSISSILFLGGLFPGAWIGGLILSRVVLSARPGMEEAEGKLQCKI
ncbi:MAG: YeeE/YedE family protein [Nitrospirae bacterium]|nr:YeeE/YedE family protein [Nitrospirota bacterium]